MSLLMQALKKAEHAKQNQEQAAGDSPHDKQVQPDISESLALTPLEQPAQAESENASFPPLPEPDLAIPDIVTPEPPLPIVQEPPLVETAEVAPPPKPAAREAAPPAEEKISKPAAPEPKRVAAPIPASKPSLTLEPKARKTAQAVFASKQPRRGSLILRIAAIGGVVILVGGAGFGYFYLQSIGNKSSVLASGASRSIAAPPQTAASAAETPPASAVLVASEPAAAETPTRSPGPEQDVQKDAAAVPAPASVPAYAVAEPSAKAVAPKLPAQSAPPGAPGIQIRQTSLVNQVNPTLGSAYQAFMSGDMTTAQRQYQQVLQQDANNRDALLGLAAIALLHNHPAQAGSYYVKLLELDPTDPEAIAGLTSLQNGTLEQNESRLKKILAQNPQAGAVHFVLGNLYAQQARWAEAQQSYFQAYGTAPANADYAFNLAVSLDRLSQSKLALEYYQRALNLAQTAPGNFSKSAAQGRIRELQAFAEN